MQAGHERSSESESLEERKRALRRWMVARRRALSRERAEAAGRSAAERLVALEEFQRARAVALYAALPDELPTRLLFDACGQTDATRLLPRCTAGGNLEFAPVECWEDLCPGRYGVLEPPVERAAVSLDSVDLVVIPGLAFDGAGRRLGRGHGYYDRVLASEAAKRLFRVGFAFAFQLVGRVPTGPLDRDMDAVVTDEETLRAAQKGASR
jgi:5-formyltetrahydrofolate cyclo-ligase